MQPLPVNIDALPGGTFLRDKQIAGPVLPVSRATLWRWTKEGHFPRPVKLSAAVTAWRVDDVRHFLAEQAAKGALK